MGKPATRTLVISSELDQVPRVQQAVLADVKAAGFSGHALFAIRLALDEALVNAIKHGNGLDAGKNVTVEYAVDPKRLSVSVCDEGPGFEPRSLPDPTQKDRIGLPHGRGVMLMRAYMTEVSYNASGNCVHLVKDADCPLPRTASDAG